MKDSSKMSLNQEKVIAGLLSQPTIALAAGKSGVSEATIYRWLREDVHFKDAYQAARKEVVSHAIVQAQKSANNAVNCLISVMNDPEAPASARVTASRVTLDFALRGLEVEDLDARIGVLEALNG